MKILHTADIHLGVKYGRLSKEKQSILKDEVIFNIRNFFEMAKKDAFDVVLICGDLFHSKTISSKLSRVFFDAVNDYQNPVIYISGNHDENFILPLNMPNNFIVLDKNKTTFSYGEFKFYSQYINESVLINNKENNILLLHGNIENARDADYLDINKYLNKGFDYIALGHVHSHKKFKSGKDIFVYPGSLFSSGFDENGVRGYVKLEIENKFIKTLKFCPFKNRNFVNCECNISNLITNREIIDKIEKELLNSNANFEDLVRIILVGTVGEDCEKSIPLILNKFNSYFHFEIEDKSTLKIDIEKIKKEKLSFKYEFISLVEESELDEENKRLVCEIGLEALKGEGINI